MPSRLTCSLSPCEGLFKGGAGKCAQGPERRGNYRVEPALARAIILQ